MERGRRTSLALLLGFLLLAAGPVRAREPAPGAASRPEAPALRLTVRDGLLLGTGAVASAVGEFVLNPDRRPVPAGGLDRSGIHLGLDRRSLDRPAVGALASSNATLVATGLAPPALFLLTGPPGERDRAFLQGVRIQSEATAAAAGAAFLLKDLVSRPRPYAYLPEAERPGQSEYDVASDRAFESFPSGHATLAYASALSAIGYLAEARPDLSPRTHFLAGFLEGGFAAATALLRIDAQAHFPTDVLAAAGIGSAAGVGVALLHRPYPAAGGSRRRAWLWSLGGLAAGTAAAALLTPPTSPWIR